MDLRTRILARAIASPGDATKFFVPDGVLDELLNQASAMTELPLLHQARGVAADRTLVSEGIHQQIHDIKDGIASFKKIFAILVLIEEAGAFQDFTENGIDDSKLPFVNKHGAKGLFYAVNGDDYTCLSFTTHWDCSVSSSFFTNQWAFLAPTFKSTPDCICHCRLPKDHVLPTTSVEAPKCPESERVVGEIVANLGSFGALAEIFKARLHPQHFDFQNFPLHDFDGKVVLKKISASDKGQFEDERHALATVARWKNQHIIPLLASFEVTQQGYYLVFPCAAGDLNHLWRSFPELGKQKTTLAWMLRECHGLTKALAYIHQGPAPQTADKGGVPAEVPSLYRHGDLTPSNIVWFPHGDKQWNSYLSIVDFGESVLGNESALRSGGDTRRATDINWTYQAPEYDGRNTLELTSAVDIWMLGCVFAEFITWYLLGTTAIVDGFAQARLEQGEKSGTRVTLDAFYTDIDGHFIVKPAVIRWLDTLSSSPRCTHCVQDFIALVRDYMVVAMPGERAQADILALKLQIIYRNCIDKDDK